MFVLLGPVDPSSRALPDLLCAVQVSHGSRLQSLWITPTNTCSAVLQVCLEGAISKESAKSSMEKGLHVPGDLIPWTTSQQFQEPNFAQLSGARIVRIAAHPELQRMGYGSRALELLTKYYSGDITSIREEDDDGGPSPSGADAAAAAAADPGGGGDLLTERLRPRSGLPPMLTHLTDRAPERLAWLGTAFGLTEGLHNYWAKAGLVPIYLRQTANDLTSEHTVLMIRALQVIRAPGATKALAAAAASKGDPLGGGHSGAIRGPLGTLAHSVLHAEGLALSFIDRSAGQLPSCHSIMS